MGKKLILTPLEKALSALLAGIDAPKNDLSRDATIQRFEYSFELCWKMLKRYLNDVVGVEEYNIKNIFREGSRVGLIENADRWFIYLKARNLTSHTYNESTAEETYSVAKDFYHDAVSLLRKLQEAVRDAS